MKIIILLLVIIQTCLVGALPPGWKYVNGTNGGTRHEYTYFTPSNYNEQNASATWPIIVWLHGIGETGGINGRQLIRTPLHLDDASVQDTYHPFILALHIDSKNAPWVPSRIKASFDELIAAYPNISPTERYITGFSWGGMGTYQTIKAYPQLFRRAVPIAGCNRAIANAANNSAVTRDAYSQTKIYAFHGTADNVGGMRQPHKDLIQTLKDDGQDVLFVEEQDRTHQDSYVWTKYDTVDWIFNPEDPFKCEVVCSEREFCVNSQCKCKDGFYGDDCSYFLIGPNLIPEGTGQGSAWVVAQPNPSDFDGILSTVNIYFLGTPENVDLQINIYEKVDDTNFKLVAKQPISWSDFTVGKLHEIPVPNNMQIEKGQYFAFVNKGGVLATANNGGNGYGYWYVSASHTDTIGTNQKLTYWSGAPSYNVVVTPLDVSSTGSGTSQTSQNTGDAKPTGETGEWDYDLSSTFMDDISTSSASTVCSTLALSVLSFRLAN